MNHHLEKSDAGYRVYLYIFYICGFIMVSCLVFGIYITVIEWMKNGTYVMGEAIQNTFIPFENFSRVSTWIFFSTIIGWYCVSRIGWKRTAENKIVGWRMALLQLMLLSFSIITLYEVLYNFTVLNAKITASTTSAIFAFGNYNLFCVRLVSHAHLNVFKFLDNSSNI